MSKTIVNLQSFQEFLRKAHFDKHGDQYERDFGHHLAEKFPNCENFWRIFVVPLTKRLDGYPDRMVRNIQFRQSIPEELEYIASAHYSMFLHLVYAHLHLEARVHSALEDVYTHLASVCDLVERVIIRWFLLLERCRGGKTQELPKEKRDEFLARMGELYDEEYSNMHEHYFSIGKVYPLRPLVEDDFIKRYLGKSNKNRKAYKTHAISIREFRNIIIHDAKIGRIIERDGKTFIPKPKVIKKYNSWRKVESVVGNEEIVSKDFAEQFHQATEDLSSLESLVNNLWDKVINDFEEEFYSQERVALRELFNIEFSQTNLMGLYTPEKASDDIDYDTSASGSFGTGGTAEFPYKGKGSA
ncbi:MAG: hypothetical protein GY797_06580 [Deltaproteobacteria bacterium]|nr:hypothetical protein [Deltaproteobacteria bacterium]